MVHSVVLLIAIWGVDWWGSVFFFFSSRRRHTRFDCDWSSDVCSSDLIPATARPGTSQDQVPERAERISRGSCIRDDPRKRGRGTAPVASRIVAIAVVQQDDGTWSELAAHARADLLGRHAGVRVPHAKR